MDGNRKSQRQRAQQQRRLNFILAMLLAAVCLLGGIGFLIDRYLIPSRTHVDLAEYYGAGEGRISLVLQETRAEEDGYVLDGKVYLPLSLVQDRLDDRYYWDGTEILYALPEEVRHILPSADTYLLQDGAPVLSLELLQQYTGIGWTKQESPDRIWIWNRWGEIPYSVCRKDTELRTEASIKGDIFQDLKEGEAVALLEDGEEWARVQTEAGISGYVRKKALGDAAVMLAENPVQIPEYTSRSLGKPVCLVWHQVTNKESNGKFQELIGRTSGVNVVSPTWFTIQDTAGNLLSFADKSYVDQAHALGMQVWALVGNLQVDIDDYAWISNSAARANTVNQLINAAAEYGFDGVNVDLEALDKSCEGHYIQFIRELSSACRKAGLILSVDNYAPTSGTAFYNRKAQAETVDYVIVMGYDEHWNGGPEAGSTASLPFVKKGIADTLAQSVPAEKLINGIPFYTRLWAEETAGLTSTAKGMDEARQLLETHGADITWDDKLNQYYGEYWGNGIHYQIWLEDAKSVQAKLNAMKEQNLAGVACWKLGLESTEVWPVIRQYLEETAGSQGTLSGE